MASSERQLSAGELIFCENEPSEHVAFLIEGEVEVFRTIGGHEIVLGIVGAGEYVGEMGVLEGRRRAASVRARTETRVRFLAREEFVGRVAKDPELARELLLRMSERLRRADDRLVRLAAATRAQPQKQLLPDIRLFADGPLPARWLPRDGWRVERLPFAVGRRPAADERGTEREVDLTLPEDRPYRLSRRHFALVSGDGGVWLVDCGSRLGTVVDGVPLGEEFARIRHRLEPGEHEVIAGGVRSPWCFRIRIAPPGEDQLAADGEASAVA